MARKWFSLIYAFLKRKYEDVDIVFVAHTDHPFELSQDEFFTTRVSGGTVVSNTLEFVNQLIHERYNPNVTNVYVSHASDGDNWSDDNEATTQALREMINDVRFFSYLETEGEYASERDTNLWEAYEPVMLVNNEKVSLAIIDNEDDCYNLFRLTFAK